MSTVYKICECALWDDWQRAGMLHGAPVDLRDGFIHLSTASQVRETAALYFAGMTGLMLVAIDGNEVAEKLKWARSRGGDLFPHHYGPLPLTAVIWAKPLALDAERRHVFPEPLA
jgi:uncharacterized protein (DUF952 family)